MPAKYESEWSSLPSCGMQRQNKIHPYSEYENTYESLAEVYPHDEDFSEAHSPGILYDPEENIPPGYYQALDYDGECHLYPIINDDAETLKQLSEQMRAVCGALCLHQTYLMHTLKTSLVTPKIINAGRKLKTATICSILHDKVRNLEKLKYAKPSEKLAPTILDQTTLHTVTTNNDAVASENSINSDDSCDSGVASDEENMHTYNPKNKLHANLQKAISCFKGSLFNYKTDGQTKQNK